MWSGGRRRRKDCYECNANFFPIHRTVLALRDGIPFDVENKRCDLYMLIHTSKMMVMMFLFTEGHIYTEHALRL